MTTAFAAFRTWGPFEPWHDTSYPWHGFYELRRALEYRAEVAVRPVRNELMWNNQWEPIR